jgi:hypothetical protein
MTILTKRHMSMIAVAALLTGCGGNGNSVDSNTTTSSIQDNYGNTYLEVTSPTTGKVWLDRNLGATQVCATATDAPCQGDLFQWGRPADGHQFSTSTTTNIPFTTIAPTTTTDPVNYNKFFTSNVNNANYVHWTTADATRTARKTFLLDATAGKLCPVGYRVPTVVEWTAETTLNMQFTSFLKMPISARRAPDWGSVIVNNSSITFWTADFNTYFGTAYPTSIYISNSVNPSLQQYYSVGYPIRCIKN